MPDGSPAIWMPDLRWWAPGSITSWNIPKLVQRVGGACEAIGARDPERDGVGTAERVTRRRLLEFERAEVNGVLQLVGGYGGERGS